MRRSLPFGDYCYIESKNELMLSEVPSLSRNMQPTPVVRGVNLQCMSTIRG